jgi:hypothetical protein
MDVILAILLFLFIAFVVVSVGLWLLAAVVGTISAAWHGGKE